MRRFNLLKFICVFIFISISFCSTAQQKNTNSLLWRISGNGLSAPSYLYGTIHLNDERVFNFGDSLYEAISHSDGFAMELNPQQLTLFIIDEIKQEMANSKKISEILSESDYKKYGPLLAKKLGKNQADISTEDIMKEKNKWIREKFKTGKMSTFVDAYLYDIARRQGKWTSGVEDLQDQLSLMNDVIDKSDIVELLAPANGKGDVVLESMIDAYINNDLDAINAISSKQDSLENDKILVKRNIRMSSRMDSLARVRTMVFAVGCAHLPGPTGIIELLRKKGFRVEPVQSSKKIKPGEYVINEKPVEWEINKDANGLYQVSMPGKAEELRMYGILTMKINIDFSKNSGYFSSALTSPYSPEKLDSAIDLISQNVFPQGKSRTQKNVTVGRGQGKLYSVEVDDGLRKGYILRYGNKIYIAMGFVSKISQPGIADIDRFLESFTILQESPTQNASKIHYVDTLRGFELDLPSKPEWMKEMSGVRKKDGMKTDLYSAQDENYGTTYIFAINTVLPGNFIENDSIYLHQIVENVKLRITAVKIDTTFIKDNILIHELAASVKQNSLLQIHSRYYVRGNRSYALVATYGSEKSVDFAREYFESFHFRDFPRENWKTEISQDSMVSAWCPAALTILKDESESVDRLYEATDSVRALAYTIVAWHLADYFWAISDSSFWAKRISSKIGRKDSLIYQKQIMNGDVPGWEFEKSTRPNLRYERYRIFRHGDAMYTVMTVKSPAEINDENTNRFFESIRFLKPALPTHLLTSHAGLLLSKLFSNDSATAAKALEYLDVAPFGVGDLDTLHRTLLRIGISEQNNPLKDRWNNLILRHIRAIHDSSSFNFARYHYMQVPDSSTELKNTLLEIMTSFPSVENFNVIADIIKTSPPQADFSSGVRRNFKDTIGLTALIIPKLLPLLGNDYACLSMMDICNPIMDSNLLDPKLLSPYASACIGYAAGRVELLRKDVDNYYELDRAVILFLRNLKSRAANDQLKQYLDIKDNFIKFKALQALMRNGGHADQSIYFYLAADKNYRISLYLLLKEVNKLTMFPPLYKTQKMFSESNIWEVVSDDYDPKAITFLFQKQVIFKGKPAKFYFFKVGFDADQPDNTYLGCYGPFSTNSVEADDAESNVEMYYDDKLSPKMMQQQANALLKRYADEN